MDENFDTTNGYLLLLKYTEAELGRIKETIARAQLIEATLSQSLAALQTIDVSLFQNVNGSYKELSDKLEYLREPGYPYNGNQEEKMLFILKKMNIAMRGYQIGEEMSRIEGILDADKLIKTLNYRLNQMVADRKLVVAKLIKHGGAQFYCLPEFFDSLERDEIVIKDEHLPNEESWRKIPAEDRNFDKVKWISFIK